MQRDWPQAFAALEKIIWGREARDAPGWQGRAMRVVRFVLVLIRDLTNGELNMRAMSLVYTTLLSIVPLLALSFSVLKAFGVHNQTEPALMRLLAPLGERGVELSHRIIGFINNMNVGVLGSVGLALLIYTAISLMQKIEASFNFIWHVTEQRRFSERFSRYLSMLLVGPLLVFAALGTTATVMSVEIIRQLVAFQPIGETIYIVGRVMPYLLVIAAFTFAYVFVPNTRVRLLPALIGGLVGGILWQTAGWGFAIFAARSTQYSAIYSGFAVLILFMIWLYVSWLILLFGASVAFYYQHPEYLVATGGEPHLSNRMREQVALSVVALIAGRYLSGGTPWTVRALTTQLALPMYAVQEVVTALDEAAVIVRTDTEPPGYLPAQEAGALLLSKVLNAIRREGDDHFTAVAAAPKSVVDLLSEIDAAIAAGLAGRTVRDIATDVFAPPETGS